MTRSRTSPFFRPVLVLLLGIAVVAGVSGCVPSSSSSASGSTSVSAGSPASLTTSGVTVTLSAKSISGSGMLSVSPTRSASGVAGVAIHLTGAKLVGAATLTFPHKFAKGEPAPLVGYAESSSSSITLVRGVKISSTGASVVTTHFSNWFTDWWGSVLQEARNLLERAYSAQASADKPTCASEAEVRKAGVTVSSSKGAQVGWCLGQDSTGVPQLTVVNARGYTATTQQTSGLTLTNPDTIYGDLIPALFSFLAPAPDVAGNKTQLLGPGDSYTYAVSGFGNQGVQVLPSGAASLATSLVFGAQTLTLLAPFLPKSTPQGTANILKALSAVQCLSDLHNVATAKVASASQAASYLKQAIPAVFGCLADVIEKQFGNRGLLTGVLVAGFAWLTSGLDAVLNDLAGAADSALNPDGYQVVVDKPVGLGFVADSPTQYTSFAGSSNDLYLTSPSRNTSCVLLVDGVMSQESAGNSVMVGCLLGVSYSFKDPPEPESCTSDPSVELVFGGGFVLGPTGVPSDACWNATEFGQDWGNQRLSLPYGHSLTYRGYIFLSETTGMSVIDVATRHGFKLSPTSYTFY
jgi:hypothetical protein